MDHSIIESDPALPAWLDPLGQPVASRLLAWEQAQVDELLADVFGYHAVQLGFPELKALRHNRMPHRWQACAEFEWAVPSPCAVQPDAWLDSRAWPWQADSLDLVVLPHTLERSTDPHACLREVERVLIPEGQVLITGLNPLSAWGWRHARGTRGTGDASPEPSLIAYRRLRDWLRLLGFEVHVSRFGGWTPALSSERWMRRWRWMDRIGERWWPILGGVYLVLATKRVPGGRLLSGRSWRAVRSTGAVAAPLARSDAAYGCPTHEKHGLDPR